jgi:outer membrane protein OmpA-like peptidoglycan-associated protein
MDTLETYQADAMERPLFRKRLFWALVASLIIHVGLVLWFGRTQLPQFSTQNGPRLVPRIFNVKNITIDDKLLQGDGQTEPPKKVDTKPALKPLDIPDDKPTAEVMEGRMTPAAPSAADVVKPIANDKPLASQVDVQAIARVQDSANKVMEEDLNSLKDSLLHDQPANVSGSLIHLPEGAAGESERNDAAAMAAASGRLDKLLGHGLHAGDAPITMPGGAMFEFGSADLRTESEEQLRKLGKLIQQSPDVTFSIEGYTDSFGDSQYNLGLSQQRADAVRSWLIQNMDVDPSHIQSVGYGAANYVVQPRAVDMHSQASIDAEKLYEQPNRRVEIKFKFPKAQ